MLFCHVFFDAPEKLPKFGAFSTLGTALMGFLVARITFSIDFFVALNTIA